MSGGKAYTHRTEYVEDWGNDLLIKLHIERLEEILKRVREKTGSIFRSDKQDPKAALIENILRPYRRLGVTQLVQVLELDDLKPFMEENKLIEYKSVKAKDRLLVARSEVAKFCKKGKEHMDKMHAMMQEDAEKVLKDAEKVQKDEVEKCCREETTGTDFNPQ